jgi:hypothetical protein
MSDTGAFCERTFTTIKDGRHVPVHVSWLLPERQATGEWGCQFKISVDGVGYRRRTVFGEDSLRAVRLSLMAAASELYLFPTPVFWLEPDDDLGFSDGSIFEALRAERAHRIA